MPPRPAAREARHARFVAVVARAIEKTDREHAVHLARLRPTPTARPRKGRWFAAIP
jgi:hypothetical protein